MRQKKQVRKTDFQYGLETILNNENTNFLKHPDTFNEIVKNSTMTISGVIRHVGRTAKTNKKEKAPTNEERVQARLAQLKNDSEEK